VHEDLQVIPLVSLLQVWTRLVAHNWIEAVQALQFPGLLSGLPAFLANYIPAYGTIGGLVLVHVVYGIPITTLIFRNYHSSIPGALMEAGKIDGAGFLGIYRHILLPLSAPAPVVVLIWQFTSIWNELGLTQLPPPSASWCHIWRVNERCTRHRYGWQISTA